ncbi:MAG: hypothetical protein J4431_00875 [Candidatus Aenigmarchaeota archaeon]|nr:hypothetical protein [Candidatus Aenigmarchaeota archaeon]
MSYYKWGISYVTRLDWLCLGGALLGIAVWAITNNPLAAVVIVTVTDAVGFFPTFRKGYDKPYEETAITFAANSVKFAFGILALETVNPATWLYPASLVLTNGAFVVLLLARRSQIPPEKGASTIKQTFK